jgi:hypothetical protein
MQALIVITAVAATVWAAHAGWFFPTGQQWFASCWDMRRAALQQHGRTDLAATSPEQAIAWRECQIEAEVAFISKGISVPGAGEVLPKTLKISCPKGLGIFHPALPRSVQLVSDTEVQIEELPFLLIDFIERAGGPSFADGFLPAGEINSRMIDANLRGCSFTATITDFSTVSSLNGAAERPAVIPR